MGQEPARATLDASRSGRDTGTSVGHVRVIARSCAFALASTFAFSLHAQSPVRQRTTYEDLQLFTQLFNQIRVNHPDSVPSHTLIMGAVRGMLAAADPHSYVITSITLDPERQKAYSDGKLYPIPLTFAFESGSPVVVAVTPGTNAATLDILPGDELIAIDGKPVMSESAFELDVELSGPKRSSAALTFARIRGNGSHVEVTRTIKRERVDDITAVPVATMLDAQTGYVRITAFENERVADDLHDALGRLEKSGMQRLVLDLRGNPGGIVSEAAKVAGEFLPKGTLVYTSSGRKSDVTDTVRVSRSFWSREKRYPLVVLIDHGSASASELVAGALQDHDRALIVGQPSFGKALLMGGFPLSDGSVAFLVIGHVKTPCGRVVQRAYRSITRRDYYRLAGAQRDTATRPSCRTDAGRVVYGGGGVYPDVVLPERDAPPNWLARLAETDVIRKWVGDHIRTNPTAYASLDALASHPALASGALASFQAFAQTQGVTLPTDSAATARLERNLLVSIADAKWGDAGRYRLIAVLDPDIATGITAFDQAAGLLR